MDGRNRGEGRAHDAWEKGQAVNRRGCRPCGHIGVEILALPYMSCGTLGK